MASGSIEIRAGRRRASAIRAVLTVLVCLTIAAAVYVRNVTKPRATPPLPLPSPNGYDDLIRAGKLATGEPPNMGKFKEAKLEELKAWVADNAEAIKVTREGLAKPSRVAVVYNQDLEAEMAHMAGCRQLSRLFSAEGEIAIREGRPVDAARSFLDGFRLGQASARGGILLDRLVGVAIERVAIDGLARVRNDLPAAELRTIVATLLEADAGRETFDDVRNAEEYWAERSLPFLHRLAFRVSGMDKTMLAPAYQAASNAFQGAQLTLRREAIEMARRLYAIEKKSEPKADSDLVPDYLPAIPQNPATGRPIDEVP